MRMTKKFAKELGRSVAQHIYKRYQNSENRGLNFVWPNTLYPILDTAVRLQVHLYAADKFEQISLDEANSTLDELLSAES